MKTYLKNIAVVGFLALFLPCTATLLLNGRDGVGLEEGMTDLEYQVLRGLMAEDLTWMADGTLELMAVLYRTEILLGKEETPLPAEVPEDEYERLCQAVEATAGQVVRIDGEYRELPYHMLSAGTTRPGTLLGEEYAYINAVECPDDRYAEGYLEICYLTEEELFAALETEISAEELELERDSAEYVTRVIWEDNVWTGESFRTLLHLSSSCFWLEPVEGSLRVTVKGSGHGFGISLYTADKMVREGADYREIIQKFYQNAECITVP